MAQLGDTIEGKYEILKHIGTGGMSKVYLAMDLRLNKQWAIKEIQRAGTDPRLNEEAVNSAIIEANMIKSFDHYYIPHINDIIEYDDYIYVVMDYVEGEPLSRIIKAEGPQNEKSVIKWGMQLTDALHYLHTRNPPIVYRDMKPSNVMIKPDGDVKLIDFGIARVYKERNLADTTILGTVGYAPPEQFGGAQTDARADIFSLGATLYHAVTGIGPKKGEAFIIRPIRDINPELSGGLEKIITKCTRQDPAARYQNCSELMYDLDHYREIDDTFLSRQKGRLRAFIIVVALFVLLMAAGFASIGMSIHATNSSYEQKMAWAQSSTATADKIAYYQQAIEVKPLEIDPYLGIINASKADTNFSLDEEKGLMASLTPHLTELRQQSFYPELAFEVGKLYWYYYDYGRSEASDDNQVTRMKSSVRWFADVMQYGKDSDANYAMARTLHGIGQFNEEIAVSVAEADDAGKYKPYWDNLSALMAATEAEQNNPEIVRLTLDSIVLDAVSNYARKFKADGVSEYEMKELCEKALADASSIEASTDRAAAEQQRINDLLAASSASAIEGAFRSERDYRGLQYE